MRRLAQRLGLTFSDELLVPTFNGQPIRADSSGAVHGYGVIRSPRSRPSSTPRPSRDHPRDRRAVRAGPQPLPRTLSPSSAFDQHELTGQRVPRLESARGEKLFRGTADTRAGGLAVVVEDDDPAQDEARAEVVEDIRAPARRGPRRRGRDGSAAPEASGAIVEKSPWRTVTCFERAESTRPRSRSSSRRTSYSSACTGLSWPESLSGGCPANVSMTSSGTS